MQAATRTTVGVAICAAVVVSFLIISGLNLDLTAVTKVPFEVVDSGDGYGYSERDNYTITDAVTWENLWSDLYSGYSSTPEVPTVNFTSEMLIAVFQGVCNSGGYLTNITRIIMTGGQYVVYVDEIHPGEGCVTTSALTYPYQIVKISDPLNLPIQFIYNIIIHECK